MKRVVASTQRFCAGLRLCPRPKPRSVRGVSLEALAGLAWFAAQVLGVEPEHVALAREAIRKIEGSCWFCGAPATSVAEVWDYEVRGSKGVATLVALKPACRRCLAVLRLEASRAAVVDRVARVNGISVDEAGAVISAAVRFVEAASHVESWEFIVEAKGLKDVGPSLQGLFNSLRASNARLRGGWIVKGYGGGYDCFAPEDPGYILDSLRALGVSPSPQLLVQPIPGGERIRVKWVTRIPVELAPDALKSLLRFKPAYVEASMAVGEGLIHVDVPVEVLLPCYDQLAYHEEAISLLRSMAAGRPIEAVLVAETRAAPYELAVITLY